ncbi:TOBE domain-containing protein [Campylobacter sp. RM16192]|uniref:TOBE domain-containing protein n=1 Tax=Campylobacter sp. RM16192 TaxID=1660080 RepID=UPI0014520CE5|nr:TOBE domain-containing protein [Campylobacter sp. RM16192]QCD53384.1 molybdenum-pterin binding domain-containing protein [Campylobacter sp. RM16192]
MSLSARNQLQAKITELKTGAVNSLVVASLKGGEIVKATVTVDSQNELDLKVGKEVVYIFKASSIIVAKGDNKLKLSATNQIKGKVAEVKLGAVNAEIDIEIAGGDKLSAIITNESAKNLALKAGDEVVAVIKASQIIIGA